MRSSDTIFINGIQYTIEDEMAKVDYEVVQNVTLEQIPEGVTVWYDGDPEHSPDAVGLCNLGDRKAEVWICVCVVAVGCLFSEDAYSQAMHGILERRERERGDIRGLIGEGYEENGFAWFAVTVDAGATQDMFDKAKKIATEMFEPLYALEREIGVRINTL